MLRSKFVNKISRFFNVGKAAQISGDINAGASSPNKKTLQSSTVGLFYPEKAVFMIRNPGSEHAHRLFEFAYPSDHLLPLMGDWENNGIMGCGLYDPKTSLFILRNQDDSGYPDITVYFGPAAAGWLPIVGDWNGDGRDSVGLYDPQSSQFFLNNTGEGGAPDVQFVFGSANKGWLPIAGDWDGDGVDGVGLYDPVHGVFYLRNDLSSGEPDHVFRYGAVEQALLPLVGDWNADGCDGIGLYNTDTGLFDLRNSLTEGSSDAQFTFGLRNLIGRPVALPWNEWEFKDIQSDKTLANRLRGDNSIPPDLSTIASVPQIESEQKAERSERLRLGLRTLRPAMKADANETDVLQ